MSPIHEWECRDCNELKEEMFNINDTPQTIPCSSCGGTMTRIISTTSFQLKGGGWCRDGYSTFIGDAINSGADIRGDD